MAQQCHSIRIRNSLNQVFEACRDVTRWSEFMPAVRHASFVESSDSWDVVEITAEANEQLLTWRSRRTIDRQKGSIQFTRLDPVAPLLYMNGEWKFSEEEDGEIVVTLIHRYEVEGGNALDKLESSIRSNASRDLKALATLPAT